MKCYVRIRYFIHVGTEEEGQGGQGLACRFLKIEKKSTLVFGRNPMIV